MSPTAKTSGWPGSVQSGSTSIRPARSQLAPDPSASRAASGDACTPAAQTFVRDGMRRTVPSGPFTSTPKASTPVTMLRHWISTPRRSSSPAAFAREPVAEGGQDLLASVEEEHLRVGRVDPAEVALEGVAGEFGDLPGDLDAGRAAADDDERQPRAAGAGVVLGLGHLERAEDPAPQLQGVVDRLHPRRPAGELVVAEVGLPGAGGDDQAVVGVVRGRAVGPGRGDDPARQVESGDGGQFHQTLRWRRRMSRIAGAISPFGEDPGRDLVQQRLEQVVVPAVDEGDLDLRPLEEPGGEQPAEAAADNHHPVRADSFIDRLPDPGSAANSLSRTSRA